MLNKLKNIFSPAHIFHEYKRYKILRKFPAKSLQLGLRTEILNTMLGFSVYIGNNNAIINSSIGDYSYINSNARIRNTIIGKFCSIGPGVKIEMGNHPINFISTSPLFYAINRPFQTFANRNYFQEYTNVVIGNDVWIGEDVLIPGGITIGDGAVVTAGAVVTKNVEPYAIVGGVPAKLIRYRFEERERGVLLESKWWEKDIQWLKKHFKLFHNPEAFFNQFNQTDF